MYLCEAATGSEAELDVLTVFSAQARAIGLPLAIHRWSLPDKLPATSRFDLAHLVTEMPPSRATGVILLGAQNIDDERLRRLRRISQGRGLPCRAYGTFETRQDRLSAAAKLSYALGGKVEIFDTAEIPGMHSAGAPVIAAPLPRVERRVPMLALMFPDAEDATQVAEIRAMSLRGDADVMIVTHGASKARWKQLLHGQVPVWHPGEVLPRALAARIDIALLCSGPMGWYRFQTLFANLVAGGCALIDGTLGRDWSILPEGILGGMPAGPAFGAWLRQVVLPDLEELREATAASRLAALFAPEDGLEELRDAATMPEPEVPPRRKIMFMPTNGVGLGHAKRCSLVAREMVAPQDVRFAAFPSCLPMINAAGFEAMPLIGRTPLRPGPENDLCNHVRLAGAAKDMRGFVFDGGYVFDSVMRLVCDSAIRAIWIRRGLWQASQSTDAALDREKIFDRIIAPREAFDELNPQGRLAEKCTETGPIVHQIRLSHAKRERLRDTLREQVGHSGRQIVVTMLGGGVAADRRPHVNAIAAHLSRRPEVLHLVVIWPTAQADAAWFTYPNTAVVRSHHASVLIGAADLFVSAAGYNSFHEALYGGVPTIFVPQMAAYMDDQRARAEAATARNIALMAEAWQPVALTQAIDACLDGQAEELRTRLAGINLPPPGNEAAARIIEEVFA